MELKDYTTKELREELKRRIAIAKEQKAKELEQAERCRNCKHLIVKNMGSGWIKLLYCGAKTYTQKGITRNYVVNKGSMCKFYLFQRK